FEGVGAGALDYFTPVARFPGFARALASTLAELRLGLIDAASLQKVAAVEPAGRDVERLLERFEEALQSGSLADRAALFEIAELALSGDPLAPIAGLPPALIDVPIWSRAEMSFVAAPAPP